MGHFDWQAVRPRGATLGAWLLLAWSLACGAAPAAALSNPSQFCSGDPCVISSPRQADPNITLDFGNRQVVVQNVITLGETNTGAIGSLTIKARSFVMNGNGQVRGFSGNSLPGGVFTVDVSDNILINSTVGSGAIRLSGQDAGQLTLIADAGPINIAGRLSIYGDGIIGSGGSLSISSGSTITVTGEIDMRGGLQGAGGDIDMTAPGDIAVSGFVDLTGGDVGGGFLDVNGGGSFTMSAADFSGSGEAGDAGFMIIDVGGDVRFTGPFRGRGADNGEDCGDGADIDVSALGDIFVQAEMDIRGRGTDCSGGSMALYGASVFVQADLLMSGTGLLGGGGDLDVTATELFRLSGSVELDGGQSGAGDFFVTSDKDIEILGGVYAIGRSAFAPGASGADLVAGARITISGTLDTSSGSSAAPGTAVGLTGCEVITNPSAIIRALGSGGSLTLTANDTLRTRGQLRAGDGGIALRYGPGAAPPDTAGTSFSPAPTSTLEPTLLPCRVCLSNTDCADGNPCTDDVCDVTQCLNPPTGNIPCEDGDECSVDDFCSEGICVSGPIGVCNDGDQDGKPDSSDECTTLIWSDPPTPRPDQNPLRFVMNFKRLSAADGEQRFLLKGVFNVAPSQPLLIDPAVNGIHLYGEDADGSFYDVSVPGGGGCGGPGEGWTTIGVGFKKVWVYRNTTNSVPPDCIPGSANGVSQVQIKDKRIRPKGGLQFKIKGKQGSLFHDPTDPLTYLQLTLGLAAQTTPGMATAQARAGQCGEARYSGNPIQNEVKPYCRTKIKRGVVDGVICKGL